MNLDFSKALDDAVRRAIEVRGISHGEIAKQLGLTKSAVDDLFKLERWDQRLALKIAYAFDFRFSIQVLPPGAEQISPQEVLAAIYDIQMALTDKDKE